MSDDDRPDITPTDLRPAVKPRVKRLRFLAILFSLLLLGLVSFVFGIFVSVASDLPSLTRFSQFKEAQSSTLTDDLGHPIGVLSQQNRVIVTPSQIPLIVKQAVIAIEDKRFESNSGIDLRGIARAFVDDIRHQGNVQGASTIEQQFIKNALVAQSHRTIFEKLREAALAFQLSHKWSKEKIITAYLNTIYFGNGAYGIEAAARTYFGHEINHEGCGEPGHKLCVEELQPWEAALLAGIIRSPTEYDPATNPVEAKRRRDLVLEQMLAQGYITRPVLEESLKQAIPSPAEIQAPKEQTVEGVDAGYFTSWVQQQVIERYGAPRAYNGGLKIKTTLDLGMQHAAERSIDNYLENPEGPTASLVAIENSTGEVRAMVGGRSYNESPFNLATEGERQPGSSFKAFDLAAALEDGISPDSVWTSKQKVFVVHSAHGPEKFVVHNDEGAYSGTNTLIGATAFSDNSIYAEVGLKVGTVRIAELAHRMGITTPLSTNPAMTIGGLTVGVTPLDMAHAYETIAHGGELVSGSLAEDNEPVGIQEVVAGSQALQDGSRRDINKVHTKRILKQQTAETETSVLEDGAAVRHRQSGRPRTVRGRQDGHHVQLRRCVVRGLGLQVHGGRVGRLPRQADPDDHQLPERTRARRDLPGTDLARLHGLGAAGRNRTLGTRQIRQGRLIRLHHGHYRSLNDARIEHPRPDDTVYRRGQDDHSWRDRRTGRSGHARQRTRAGGAQRAVSVADAGSSQQPLHPALRRLPSVIALAHRRGQPRQLVLQSRGHRPRL